MTIAIAIKTGAAVVFAADSKVTTNGPAGYDQDGQINWLSQTYDNAYKVAHDRNRSLMAMVAGHANIGSLLATDFIGAYTFDPGMDKASQEAALKKLGVDIAVEIKSYWGNINLAVDQWQGPTLLVATPTLGERTARVWSGALNGTDYEFAEILPRPGIKLEGSYSQVMSLLYGFDVAATEAIAQDLGFTFDQFMKSWSASKVLSTISKISLHAMPTQDAIDLAYFLASVQVQMDRFLPGEKACGGPIDVMVLQLMPVPTIVGYLGKTLHHPGPPLYPRQVV